MKDIIPNQLTNQSTIYKLLLKFQNITLFTKKKKLDMIISFYVFLYFILYI